MSKDNKKSKVKMKVNAFDIFVLLLVLCLIATLVFKIYMSASDEENTANSKVMLSFACEGEYNSILDYLHEGDEIYLESGEILGYIYKSTQEEGLFEIVTKAPTEDSDTTGEAEATMRTSETAADYSRIDFIGQISLNGNAQKSNKGSYYIIGDDNVTVGGRLNVHTRRAEFTITVTSIDEIENY